MQRHLIKAIYPDGQEVSFECSDEAFMLDEADNAGVELPYSCRNGGCLRCCARLLDGEIEMEEQYVLEQSDIDNNYFLPCCSKAKTDVRFLVDQVDALEEHAD